MPVLRMSSNASRLVEPACVEFAAQAHGQLTCGAEGGRVNNPWRLARADSPDATVFGGAANVCVLAIFSRCLAATWR